MFVWVLTHAVTNQELLIPWGILQWPRSIHFGTKNFFFSISGSVLRSAWQKVIWHGTFAQETWTVAGSNKMVQQQPCPTVLLNAYDTVSSKQKFSGCQLWGSSFERKKSRLLFDDFRQSPNSIIMSSIFQYYCVFLAAVGSVFCFPDSNRAGSPRFGFAIRYLHYAIQWKETGTSSWPSLPPNISLRNVHLLLYIFKK